MHNETYSSVVAALFLTPFLVNRQENGTTPVCRPFLLLPYSFTQFPQEVNPELSGCLPKLRVSSSTPVDFPFASWFSACVISSLSGGGSLSFPV